MMLPGLKPHAPSRVSRPNPRGVDYKFLGNRLYCTQPSVALLALVFLTGWLGGLLTCACLLWWVSGFGFPPVDFSSSSSAARQPPVSTRARLLATYLHEPRAFSRARDH